jgi:hypothetical protein
MDQLRNALRGVGLTGVAPPVEERAGVERDGLPDPLASDWVALMRSLGAEVPAGATLGQLQARSDARVKALRGLGRAKDADALKRAREAYAAERAQRAWTRVKARFAELELPDKAYRALKQENAEPEKVLGRLRGSRGEALKGAGSARVRDALLE